MGSTLSKLTVCLISFLVPSILNAQSYYGTLSFSPAHPTTNDPIKVVLSPAQGEPNWCAFHSGVSGNIIGIIAFPFDCSSGNGTQNFAVIGKVPAGTYQVIWTYTDNFYGDPVPTAQLTVVNAPAEVPALSIAALVWLSSSMALFGLWRRRALAR
jgi:hypothetical protein